jgi:capsule polysaccharide export protein KpsE/RkpR
MSNLESSNSATEPRSGLAGVTGVGGVVWGALKATFQRIGQSISFWSVVATAALLSTVYYYVFAESLYDSQAILSIQNKGSVSSGVGSILSSALGSSGSSTQAGQIVDYINSMEMLRILDKKYHLRTLYRSGERNPFWRLYFADTDENFLWFYQHMFAVDSDTDDGTLTIDIYDYDRVRAHQIGETITQESEKFINDINTKMQQQTMLFARNELTASVKAVAAAKTPEDQSVAEMRLTAAQQALASVEGAANQQTVFIVPISASSLPTETTEPERLFNIVTITVISALVYAVGFLMWSNVRDHRKA